MKIHYTDEDAIRELLMGHSVEVIGPTSSLCGASETTMTDDEKLMNAWREMREGFHHSLNYDEMFAAIDRALADIPDTDIAYAAGCEAGYANGYSDALTDAPMLMDSGFTACLVHGCLQQECRHGSSDCELRSLLYVEKS